MIKALGIVPIYAAILLLSYLMQDKVIFYPEKTEVDHGPYLIGYSEHFLETKDMRIHGLYYQKNADDPVILYFHGNAGNLESWQYIREDFADIPCNLFIIDYPSFGKSTGPLTPKTLLQSGHMAYGFLRELGYPGNRIIVYGRSIGSAVALDVASRHPCRLLILESPFSSMIRLGWEKFPFLIPPLILRYRYANQKRIADIDCPVVLFHGVSDDLIPIDHSRRLLRAARKAHVPARLVAIEHGGHNNLSRFEDYRRELRKAIVGTADRPGP